MGHYINLVSILHTQLLAQQLLHIEQKRQSKYGQNCINSRIR